MRYINQKVFVKERERYQADPIPSGNGVIIDENRCSQTGAINGVYVMITDTDSMGHVQQVPLTDLVFKDPKSVLQEEEDPFAQVLALMFGAENNIEA